MRYYDHLFFDLDNTLWNFSANSAKAMKLTLEQVNILHEISSFEDFFLVYEQINDSLWEEYRQNKIEKSKLIIERFSQSFEKTGLRQMNWAELNELYLSNMAIQTELFPETIKTLTILKSKGYQMHIITNGFKEVQHLKLTNSGLSEFFTKIFISEEVKANKPHRPIFEYAIKSTNAKKKKSIMIGDSWETDIEGALNFGMDQVMFLNNGLHEIPDTIKNVLSQKNSSFLNLGNQTKTRFIQNISELQVLL